jgi:hypothetical protein
MEPKLGVYMRMTGGELKQLRRMHKDDQQGSRN